MYSFDTLDLFSFSNEALLDVLCILVMIRLIYFISIMIQVLTTLIHHVR